MIGLTNIVVKRYDPTFIEVDWRVDTTTESISNYRLNIFQSSSPSNIISSDYIMIASGINLMSVDYYHDYSISGLTSKFDTFSYVLQISGLTGQTRYYPAVLVTVTQDNIAREIIRRRSIVFNTKSASDFLFFKRKTHGQFCPDSYDPVLGRTTKSKCTSCFDTGFIGGYFSPVQLRGQLNEGPTRTQLTVFGSFQDQDAIFYTKGFPQITQKDILVDRLGRHWNIVTVRSFNKALYTIGQQCQVRQIEKEDITSSLPVVFR